MDDNIKCRNKNSDDEDGGGGPTISNDEFNIIMNQSIDRDTTRSTTSDRIKPNDTSSLNIDADNNNYSHQIVQHSGIQYERNNTKINPNITSTTLDNSSNRQYLLNDSNINVSRSYVMGYDNNGMNLVPRSLVQIPVSYTNSNHMINPLKINIDNSGDTNFISNIGLGVHPNTTTTTTNSPLNTGVSYFDVNIFKYTTNPNDTVNNNLMLPSIIQDHIDDTNTIHDKPNIVHNTFDGKQKYLTYIYDNNNDSMRPLPPLQVALDTDMLKSNDDNNTDNCTNNDSTIPCLKLNDSNSSGYICYFCGCMFNNIADFNVHTFIHSNNNLSYDVNNNDDTPNVNICKVCGHTLRTISVYENGLNALIIHSDKNLSSTIEVCDSCGKEYQCNNVLPSDASNSGSSSNKAKNRKKRSNSFNNLSNNIVTMSRNGNQTHQNLLQTISYHERYYCQRCVKSYKHNRDLRKHEKIVHGLQQQQLSTVSRDRSHIHGNVFSINELHDKNTVDTISTIVMDSNQTNSFIQCDDNNNIATNMNYVERNNDQNKNNIPTESTTTNNTSDRYYCDKCNKSFRGPFELRRHILTIHENKKPFKCNQCGKFFRDTYELKRHNISQHKLLLNKLEFVTDITSMDNLSTVDCVSQATFQCNVDGIISHESSNPPTDINEYQTKTINKQLKSLTDREKYGYGDIIQRHPTNNILPKTFNQGDYYCGICDKHFRGSNEFKRHFSIVHEKKYRYKCINCGKLWRDQYDLKRHCKRSHFIGRDIDKAFIRQCLVNINVHNNNLNHSDNTVSRQNYNHIHTNTSTDIVQSPSKHPTNNINNTCSVDNFSYDNDSNSNTIIDKNTEYNNYNFLDNRNQLDLPKMIPIGSNINGVNSSHHFHKYETKQHGQ